MSKNIDQIYIAAPITTNLSTDLMYFGRSPYGLTDDHAMTYADFAAQFGGGATSTQVQQLAFNVGLDTGIADAYVVDLSPVVTVLTDQLIVAFYPLNANATITPNLQVNGTSPKLILNPGGEGLVPGDLSPEYPAVCMYIEVGNYFLLLTPFLSIVTQSQVQAFSYNTLFDLSGTPNVYSGSLTPDVGSLPSGSFAILFATATANTGASTLSINSELPTNITLPGRIPLSGGEILTTRHAVFIQSTGNVDYTLLNPAVINPVDPSKTILTPSSGDTILISILNKRTILNPSGTLTTLTINMPASPVNGQFQIITTTQIITALTVSGNGNSIIGQPTTLTAGQSFTMIFDQPSSTWYPG